MAPQAGRQQGGPDGTQFRSTATTSHSLARPQGAAQTPLHHSSSSIYDNDDETEAVLALAFGQTSDDEERFVDDRERSPSRQEKGPQWDADEYGFRDPPSPSPTTSTRLPRSGFLASATRRQAGQYLSNDPYAPSGRYDAAYGGGTPRIDDSADSISSAAARLPIDQGVGTQAGPPRSLWQGNAQTTQQSRGFPGVIKPMPVRAVNSTQFSQPPRQQQQRPVSSTRAQPPQTSQALGPGARTQQQPRAVPAYGTEEDEEAEYWRDDPFEAANGEQGGLGDAQDFEQALITAEQSAREAMARTAPVNRSAVSQKRPQQDVRYLEDLEAVGNETSAARLPQAGLRKQSVKLKPVSSLPDMFRSLWRFGVFNAVQSTCFDSVYGTDENVVISAPTGAGKTVLFELAMLRLFTASSSADAKVLYMAPTKSLCSERVVDWKKKFEVGLGWTVQELTGDSDYSSGAWRDVAKARILVTTPEKWDAMTRKWHDHGTTLGQLRLFCIDEVHSVGSDRGAVLEVVVSRMKTLGTSTRFVAVSATVPNIADVAEWLGSDSADDKPAKVFQFGDDFRPCKLQKIVLGYPRGSNDFAFANSLSFKLYDLIKQYSSGKPVLVFCNTRKSCTQAAEALLKSYKEAVASHARRDPLAWPKPSRGEYKTGDKSLSALLEYGIAVHHAGMEMNDRKLVERLFIDGKISIVCSTSTLAVGVNLPARMVIIRGTKSFADGAMREYTDLEVLQMIGRAGRPQFDTLGVAVIMTEKGSESKYSDLVNAQTRLESCLHNSLTEHVNSEIALGTIQDIGSALHWLRSTFLFVRITKTCAFYGLGKDTASPEQHLEEICLRAVDQLVQSGIVEREEDTLVANQYGDIMSRFYISHETFLAIKTLPLKSTMRTLLETISNASEMSSYRFRQGEKNLFLKLNKGLKFPTSKVVTTADRVMILIQLALEGVPGSELKTDSTNPMLDLRSIFVAVTRIAKCMIDVAIAREDGGIRTMLELLRSLNGRGWDNSALVLRQLEGIGEKSYKALASAGITSINDVRNADADRLQIILSRKPPYGHKLISQARSIPQFELTLVSKNETTCSGTGVQVDLTVDLRLKQSKPLPVTKRGGVKFWATVATTTSDNEFIDFRRARLDQLLNQPKQFDLSVVLVKPSQKLVLSVSCDHIAGSEVKLVIRPDTPAREFPLPSLDLQDEVEDAGEETTESVVRYDQRPDSSAKERAGQKAAPKKARLEAPGSGPAQRRPDGKYECNHACGDKTKCKHLCCREGLEKPPAQRKSAGQSGRATKPAAAAADTAPKPPPKKATRLKPLASTRVSLSLNASGKAVAREIASDEDELDSDSSSSSSSLSIEVDRAGASVNIGRKLANKSHRARNAGSSTLQNFSLDVFASPSPPHGGAKGAIRSTFGDPALRGSPADFGEPKEHSLRRPKQVRQAGDRTESSKRLRLSSPQAESASAAESHPALAATPARPDDNTSSSSEGDAAGLFLPFTDDAEMVDEGITNTTFTDADPFADLRAGSPDLRDDVGDDKVTKLTEEGAKHANRRPENDAQSEEPAGEEPTNEEDDFDAWLDSNVLVV